MDQTSIKNAIIGRWRWRLSCCWPRCSSRSASANPKPPGRQPPDCAARGGQAVAVSGSAVPARRLLFGSPSSALREYKAGKYDAGAQGIRAAAPAQRGRPSPPFQRRRCRLPQPAVRRSRQAVQRQPLASPDLESAGAAPITTAGNALYPPRRTIPDPKQRTEAWEKSLQDYQSTLKLNPQDADAKFNHEFVKKRIEELKQQQQQSQKQQAGQDQKQDQQKQDQQQQDRTKAGPTEGPATTEHSRRNRTRSRTSNNRPTSKPRSRRRRRAAGPAITGQAFREAGREGQAGRRRLRRRRDDPGAGASSCSTLRKATRKCSNLSPSKNRWTAPSHLRIGNGGVVSRGENQQKGRPLATCL